MASSSETFERTIRRYPLLKRLVDREDWKSRFLGSIRQQLLKTGTLTPRQALQACKVVAEEQAKEKFLRKRDEELKEAEISVPEGWTTVSGMIRTVKWRYRHWTMLLDTFEGYRVFGPVPAFLFFEYEDNLDKLQGKVVTLRLKLKPQGEDFAIYDDCAPVQAEATSSGR